MYFILKNNNIPFYFTIIKVSKIFQTWLCIAIVVGLMGPLLNVFHVLSPYYEYHSIPRKGGLNSPLNCFWYVYGALLQQGKSDKNVRVPIAVYF